MKTDPQHQSSTLDQPLRSVHTDSFATILTQLGISLVVSTYQAGKLIVMRAEDGTSVNTHFRVFQKPMGLAFNGDRLWTLDEPLPTEATIKSHIRSIRRKLEKAREPFEANLRIIRANDGAVRYINARGGPVFDKAGRLLKLTGTTFDLTRWLAPRLDRETRTD